jgi:hypothetical protein
MSISLSTTFPSLTDTSSGGACNHTSPSNDTFPVSYLDPYVFVISSDIPHSDAVEDCQAAATNASVRLLVLTGPPLKSIRAWLMEYVRPCSSFALHSLNEIHYQAMLVTYCDANCTGNANTGQSGPSCYGAGPGYVLSDELVPHALLTSVNLEAAILAPSS